MKIKPQPRLDVDRYVIAALTTKPMTNRELFVAFLGKIAKSSIQYSTAKLSTSEIIIRESIRVTDKYGSKSTQYLFSITHD